MIGLTIDNEILVLPVTDSESLASLEWWTPGGHKIIDQIRGIRDQWGRVINPSRIGGSELRFALDRLYPDREVYVHEGEDLFEYTTPQRKDGKSELLPD